MADMYNESVAQGRWYGEWSNEKKLRKDFANTLKEMDKLESEFKKLTKKGYELETQINIQTHMKSLKNEYSA